MVFIGSDPDQLENLAKQLTANADRLDEIRNMIGGQLHHGPWFGPDADRMCHEWDVVHVRAMLTCGEALREVGATARSNAAAQRDVSSDGGGVMSGAAPESAAEKAIEYFEAGLHGVRRSGDKIDKYLLHVNLEDVARAIPHVGETLAHALRAVPFLTTALDGYDLFGDVRKGDVNAAAFDTAMLGIDGTALAFVAIGALCPPSELVIAPAAIATVEIAGAVGGVISAIPGGKDFVGGMMLAPARSAVDNFTHPFQNPLEIGESVIENPVTAPIVIGAGVMGEGVKLFKKIF